MHKAFFSFIASIGCIFAPLPAAPIGAHMAEMVEIQDQETKKIVYGVADRFIAHDASGFSIKEHLVKADIVETSGSAKIYFVCDNLGKPEYVIKMRDISDANDAREWKEEKESLLQFGKVKNQSFHLAKLIGETTIEQDGVTYGLFIEEMAKGDSLNSLLKQYYLEIDPQSKEALLTTIKLGAEKTGASLAALHNSHPMGKLNSHYKERFNRVQDQFGKKIFDTLPGPYSYLHGDVHPGNIYYDRESDSVTLIDLSSAYSSLSGGPIGYDLGEFLMTLEVIGSYYGLTEGQITDISDAFLDGYRNSGGPNVSDDTINLYYTLFLLEFSQDSRMCDPKQYEQCQFITKYLKTKLANYSSREV